MQNLMIALVVYKTLYHLYFLMFKAELSCENYPVWFKNFMK